MSEENNDIENSKYSFNIDGDGNIYFLPNKLDLARVDKSETHYSPRALTQGTMGIHRDPSLPNPITTALYYLRENHPELGEVIQQELERIQNQAESDLFRALPVEVEKTENAIFETKSIEFSIGQEIDLNCKRTGLEFIYTSKEFKELADFYENHPYKLNLAIPAAKVIGNMFNYEDVEDIKWVRRSLFGELVNYCQEKPELLDVVIENVRIWTKPLLSSNE